MADTKKTIPFPFDPENPELNKISSLVTYPDVGSLVDADNGRIYESAIGFPYANTKSVPNDWSCMPCPGKENMPEYDNISFGIQSGQTVSVNSYYSPAYPVKIVQKDNSYSIVFPLKPISKRRRQHVLRCVRFQRGIGASPERVRHFGRYRVE